MYFFKQNARKSEFINLRVSPPFCLFRYGAGRSGQQLRLFDESRFFVEPRFFFSHAFLSSRAFLSQLAPMCRDSRGEPIRSSRKKVNFTRKIDFFDFLTFYVNSGLYKESTKLIFYN